MAVRRVIGIFSIVILVSSCVFVPCVYSIDLPALPNQLLSPTAAFHPILMEGMKIRRDDPLKFDFIFDAGDDQTDVQSPAFNQEATKSIKYFLASLTVPDNEMWVNLSPYERTRIIAEGLGKTELGRDLLKQDYTLKRLTASLLYPESAVGKNFWAHVYQSLAKRCGQGSSQDAVCSSSGTVPVNTFNKVWIVPDRAVVYEKGDTVLVKETHFKVMLESDYLALSKAGGKVAKADEAKKIIREIVLPELEREVNAGKNFANLRQIYSAMILAVWFKSNLKESILGKVYADQNKTSGVDAADQAFRQKIYEEYLRSFRKGVYNYIREEADPITHEIIPRKYFSGGLVGVDRAMIRTTTDAPPVLQEPIVVEAALLEQRAAGASGIASSGMGRMVSVAGIEGPGTDIKSSFPSGTIAHVHLSRDTANADVLRLELMARDGAPAFHVRAASGTGKRMSVTADPATREVVDGYQKGVEVDFEVKARPTEDGKLEISLDQIFLGQAGELGKLVAEGAEFPAVAVARTDHTFTTELPGQVTFTRTAADGHTSILTVLVPAGMIIGHIKGPDGKGDAGISIKSMGHSDPVTFGLTVRVTTDYDTLTPLPLDEIYSTYALHEMDQRPSLRSTARRFAWSFTKEGLLGDPMFGYGPSTLISALGMAPSLTPEAKILLVQNLLDRLGVSGVDALESNFLFPLVQEMMLSDTADDGDVETFLGSLNNANERYLVALLRQWNHVLELTDPYTQGFMKLRAVHLRSDTVPPRGLSHMNVSSLKEFLISGQGGRPAGDINGVLAPLALQKIRSMIKTLKSLGYKNGQTPAQWDLRELAKANHLTMLLKYLSEEDGVGISSSVEAWSTASKFFEKHLDVKQIREHVSAYLSGGGLNEEQRGKALDRVISVDTEDQPITLRAFLDPDNPQVPELFERGFTSMGAASAVYELMFGQLSHERLNAVLDAIFTPSPVGLWNDVTGISIGAGAGMEAAYQQGVKSNRDPLGELMQGLLKQLEYARQRRNGEDVSRLARAIVHVFGVEKLLRYLLPEEVVRMAGEMGYAAPASQVIIPPGKGLFWPRSEAVKGVLDILDQHDVSLGKGEMIPNIARDVAGDITNMLGTRDPADDVVSAILKEGDVDPARIEQSVYEVKGRQFKVTRYKNRVFEDGQLEFVPFLRVGKFVIIDSRMFDTYPHLQKTIGSYPYLIQRDTSDNTDDLINLMNYNPTLGASVSAIGVLLLMQANADQIAGRKLVYFGVDQTAVLAIAARMMGATDLFLFPLNRGLRARIEKSFRKNGISPYLLKVSGKSLANVTKADMPKGPAFTIVNLPQFGFQGDSMADRPAAGNKTDNQRGFIATVQKYANKAIMVAVAGFKPSMPELFPRIFKLTNGLDGAVIWSGSSKEILFERALERGPGRIDQVVPVGQYVDRMFEEDGEGTGSVRAIAVEKAGRVEFPSYLVQSGKSSVKKTAAPGGIDLRNDKALVVENKGAAARFNMDAGRLRQLLQVSGFKPEIIGIKQVSMDAYLGS